MEFCGLTVEIKKHGTWNLVKGGRWVPWQSLESWTSNQPSMNRAKIETLYIQRKDMRMKWYRPYAFSWEEAIWSTSCIQPLFQHFHYNTHFNQLGFLFPSIKMMFIYSPWLEKSFVIYSLLFSQFILLIIKLWSWFLIGWLNSQIYLKLLLFF